LCARIKEPDEDNYSKLVKVMQHIKGSKELTLTTESDDGPKWWVDSLYAVQPDMRSHQG